MKKAYIILFFLPLLITSRAQILPVKVCTQEQREWCWAAVSQCILDYYGVNVEQCEIAEYTRTVATWHDFGTTPCCSNPGGPCNYWNYNWGQTGSIQDILVHFGQLNNTGVGSALSFSQVVQQFALNRPFIIRWAWVSGGGHFLVGHGLNGETLYYMDSWSGEGAKFANYSQVVSGTRHTWTHTSLMSSSPSTSSDILTPEENIIGVRIYPNPSDGLINVALTEKSIIRIYDSMGKQVAQYNVNAHSELKLNKSSGTYFIHVENNGKISTHKVIVQR